MTGQDDFEVPDLGPAERNHIAHRQAAAPARQKAAPAQPAGRAGDSSWLHSVLMIVLVVALGALAYWTLLLQEQLQLRSAELAETRAQLAEFRQSLNIAESSAEQSGQTLQGQVATLRSGAEEKYKHFDSEIAKLWTIAYQRNKPQLESQDKALKTQAQTLDTQGQALDEQKKQLAAAGAELDQQAKGLAEMRRQLTALAQQQATDQKAGQALDARVDAWDKQIKAERKEREQLQQQIAGAQKELAQAERAVTADRVKLREDLQAQGKTQRELSDRLAALESSQRASGPDPALERRIRSNEEAVQAFDSTRRQLTHDMLQVRQKLNNLQLKVEQNAAR